MWIDRLGPYIMPILTLWWFFFYEGDSHFRNRVFGYNSVEHLLCHLKCFLLLRIAVLKLRESKIADSLTIPFWYIIYKFALKVCPICFMWHINVIYLLQRIFQLIQLLASSYTAQKLTTYVTDYILKWADK